MMEEDPRYKEYEQRKIEHLKEKKHERYFPVPTGDGYLIIDKLAREEGYNEKGYNLRCGVYGEPVKDDKYKSLEEFMDLLNNLDLKVNGGLEDKDMVLFSKPNLYTLIESKLDTILEQDLTYPEKFNVAIQTGNVYDGLEVLNVDCTVYKSSGLSPLLDNPDFRIFLKVINNRIDELEKEDLDENNIRVDELLTIKRLLLEKGEEIPWGVLI